MNAREDGELLLAQGESETVEFKKSTKMMKAIIETLCAFANTCGGDILIGVDDDGRVLGQQISDDTLKNAANEIKLNTDPKLYPSIRKIILDNRPCLLISIEESPLKPHLAYGKPFVRVGATNQRVDREMYAYMLEQRYNGYGFDHLPIPDVGIDDLDIDLLYKDQGHSHPAGHAAAVQTYFQRGFTRPAARYSEIVARPDGKTDRHGISGRRASLSVQCPACGSDEL